MTLSLALRLLAYWLSASVVCAVVWMLTHPKPEPPHRERRRRQLRALREVETLTPVIPDRMPDGREWP